MPRAGLIIAQQSDQKMSHPILNIADVELKPRPAAFAAPGERDRRDEAVRPRPDDDSVVRRAQPTSVSADERFSRTISRAITSRWISFVPS